MVQLTKEIPIWDGLNDFTKALIHTLLFFLAPVAVATGFSDGMWLRFIQVLGMIGLVFLGFIIRDDLKHIEDKGAKTDSTGGA